MNHQPLRRRRPEHAHVPMAGLGDRGPGGCGLGGRRSRRGPILGGSSARLWLRHSDPNVQDRPQRGVRGDACGIGLVSMKVPTPDTERMAILVTVSFDYTTSAADRGSIGVGFGGSDPLDPLWPRERPLSPSALPTSTTLVWSGKDLPAGGDASTVRVAVNVRSGGHTRASTRHMTVVVTCSRADPPDPRFSRRSGRRTSAGCGPRTS
jgi:hypothetical protein